MDGPGDFIGDLLGVAAPIAGGFIGGSLGGAPGAALGIGLGGTLAGGFGAGQAQSEAQQRQQQFLRQQLNARRNSPLTQRLLGLLGIQQTGGLDELTARRDKLQAEIDSIDPSEFASSLKKEARQKELDNLNSQIALAQESEAGFGDLASQITGVRRRGTLKAQEARQSALESALGQAGQIGGGLGARALSQVAGQTCRK